MIHCQLKVKITENQKSASQCVILVHFLKRVLRLQIVYKAKYVNFISLWREKVQIVISKIYFRTWNLVLNPEPNVRNLFKINQDAVCIISDVIRFQWIWFRQQRIFRRMKNITNAESRKTLYWMKNLQKNPHIISIKFEIKKSNFKPYHWYSHTNESEFLYWFKHSVLWTVLQNFRNYL